MILYNLILVLFLPVFLLLWNQKKISGKYKKSIGLRFGFFPFSKDSRPVMLVHAVSVGETVAAQPFVNALKKHFPGTRFVISNVTEAGHQRAKEIFPDCEHVFFPLDYNFSITLFLDKINPSRVFILETEIWPNFLSQCKRRNIPVSFVNGRISLTSFQKYKLARPLLKKILPYFDFFMQSQEDAKRILELGALNVQVCGNLKFDQLGENLKSPLIANFQAWRQKSSAPVVLFGSSHQQETFQILERIQKRKNDFNDVLFVIAPRHLHLLPLYLQKAKELDLKFYLKSDSEEQQGVLFLDTMGELAVFYSVCDISVVCGSFEPIGGHSLLEPALFAKPIIHGPHMQNSKEIAQQFEASGASLKTMDLDEAFEKIQLLLANPDLGYTLGKNARELVFSRQGACDKILSHFSHINKN